MFSTVDFFDLVMERYQLRSDYALAKLLGCSAALICKHRARPFGMNNDLALKVAELLGHEPCFVMACVSAERAKSPDEKECFLRLAAMAKLYAAQFGKLPESRKAALV